MRGGYIINYVQDNFKTTKQKLILSSSKYRLIITLIALIMIDHSFEYKIEKDLHRLIQIKKSLEKLEKDEEIQFLVQESSHNRNSKDLV